MAAGGRDVSLRSLADNGLYGIEGVVRDAPEGDAATGTIWTTTMKSWQHLTPCTPGFNAMETDDPTQRIKVGRPRLVDELLALPGKAVLGGSVIRLL